MCYKLSGQQFARVTDFLSNLKKVEYSIQYQEKHRSEPYLVQVRTERLDVLERSDDPFELSLSMLRKCKISYAQEMSPIINYVFDCSTLKFGNDVVTSLTCTNGELHIHITKDAMHITSIKGHLMDSLSQLTLI